MLGVRVEDQQLETAATLRVTWKPQCEVIAATPMTTQMIIMLIPVVDLEFITSRGLLQDLPLNNKCARVRTRVYASTICLRETDTQGRSRKLKHTPEKKKKARQKGAFS